MKAFVSGAAIAAGALAVLFVAAPVKIDLGNGGLAVKSADARVFKHGSSQRPPGGAVNPADPGGGGKSVQVPNTKGGGGKGGGGGGGGHGGKSK